MWEHRQHSERQKQRRQTLCSYYLVIPIYAQSLRVFAVSVWPPKAQQTHCLSWPCVTDFYHLQVWQWWIRPKREGQQLCSLAQHLHKPQHRALSSYLHPMCQFYLPLWIETKGPDDQSLWLFPYHKQSEAKAAVAPRCTERLRQLYWALLFHYFYKICCSTFTNVLWSIINN